VAASLAGALCLTACAFLEPTPPAPPPEPVPEADIPPPPPLAEPPPPRPARKPAPPPVAHTAPPSPAEPTVLVDPEHVIGLDEGAASDWLGAPASRTEAPPATIWHYASQDCEVDVYFYLDLQNRVMRALHYEVRSNDIVEQRPERCFQQLVDEHRQRSGASAAYSPR